MKYYIDEPDLIGHPTGKVPPLIGVTKDTVFFESRQEAERHAERLSESHHILYCVWEFDETKETIL